MLLEIMSFAAFFLFLYSRRKEKKKLSFGDICLLLGILGDDRSGHGASGLNRGKGVKVKLKVAMGRTGTVY